MATIVKDPQETKETRQTNQSATVDLIISEIDQLSIHDRHEITEKRKDNSAKYITTHARATAATRLFLLPRLFIVL